MGIPKIVLYLEPKAPKSTIVLTMEVSMKIKCIKQKAYKASGVFAQIIHSLK